MTTSLELIGLLRQIRGAGSTLQKLKSAALAWRTLRGLSREERLEIARELGLEGAELIVEGLGQRNGLSPSDLLGAIHAAEQADDSQLSELLQALKDPEQRARIAQRAAQAAEEWAVSELAGNQSGETEESAPPLAEGAEEPFLLDDEDAAEAVVGAGPSVQDLVASDVFATSPDPPPPQRRDAPPTEPRRVAVAALPAKPTVAARPVPSWRRSTSPTPPPETPPAELAAELRAVPSVIRRLARLGEILHAPPQLSTAQWAEVGSCFAPGWPRRRALAQIFRAGCPDDFHDAIVLLDDLAESGDRLWLLAALADRRGLRPSHGLRLLELAAGSPALERRVRHRLAQST